jgi:uracil-DNA glycosylase family 4
MPFANLIGLPDPVRKAKKKPLGSKGCNFCPLNKVHGVNKIFGQVTGKKIFVWAQSPGANENYERKELIGAAGQFLWKHMNKAGITRDMCDIQNVVRCFPADALENGRLIMRSPTKEEIHCCSTFNDHAMMKSKAALHLVFGDIAQKALLGKQAKKGQRVFWSSKLNARVFCLNHPAYFLRGFGHDKLKEFDRLLKVAALLAKLPADRYAYVKSRKYIGVRTKELALVAAAEIREDAKKGRIAADLEDGIVDGNRVSLCYGFCGRPGKAWVFDMRIPEVARIALELLADKSIKIVFHYGCYDVVATEKETGVKVAGYDYDTNIGEFFDNPEKFSYALPKIAERKFQQFVGYKSIIIPYALTEEFKKRVPQWKTMDADHLYGAARKKRDSLNYAQIPWDLLVAYNGADCDLTKRLELSHDKSRVPIELMRVYRDVAFVLSYMEEYEQTIFDYRHYGNAPSRSCISSSKTRISISIATRSLISTSTTCLSCQR